MLTWLACTFGCQHHHEFVGIEQGFVLEMQRMDGKSEDPFFFIVNLQVSLATVFLDRRNQEICLPCGKK
jgi:hypothetical protein